MSLRKLPEVKAFTSPEGYQWDIPADVLAKVSPLAAEADTGATISIYEDIGYDYWTGGGFTAKRAAAALRSIGPNPVEVLINSGGGDMFEGLAIYNTFREHPAEVTIKVMGIAASAASIIAMAGDKVVMGMGSFLMIHNSWGIVIGNQDDFAEARDTFAEFDMAMAEIYEARTGLKLADIKSMMSAETWLRASEAVKKGFADATTDEEATAKAAVSTEVNARRRLDHILAEAKLPRSERRKLVKEAIGTHDAADSVTHDADPAADADFSADLAALLKTIRG